MLVFLTSLLVLVILMQWLILEVILLLLIFLLHSKVSHNIGGVGFQQEYVTKLADIDITSSLDKSQLKNKPVLNKIREMVSFEFF